MKMILDSFGRFTKGLIVPFSLLSAYYHFVTANTELEPVLQCSRMFQIQPSKI